MEKSVKTTSTQSAALEKFPEWAHLLNWFLYPAGNLNGNLEPFEELVTCASAAHDLIFLTFEDLENNQSLIVGLGALLGDLANNAREALQGLEQFRKVSSERLLSKGSGGVA